MTVTSSTGRVVRDAEGMRLEFVRVLDAPIHEVWSALTESERTTRWFGAWTGDPSTGTIELVLTAEDDDSAQTVRILECTEPTRLVVEAPSPDGPWLLSAALTSDGGSTTLVFTHRMAEPYDASSIGPGWQYYLDRFDAVVSGGPVPVDFNPYMADLAGTYPLPD